MAHPTAFTLALESVQKRLAPSLFALAENAGGTFKEVCLDARGGHDGSHIVKVHVVRDGGQAEVIATNPQVSTLVNEIWQMRVMLPDDELFYGYKLSVKPEGEPATSFDNNPNCAKDPEFKSVGGGRRISKMFDKFEKHD
jgi:hypothetical protein